MRSFGSAQTKGFYPIINTVVMDYIASIKQVVKRKKNLGNISEKLGTMTSQILNCRRNKQNNNRFVLDDIFRPLSLTAICKVAFGLGDGVKIQLIQEHFNGIFSLQKESGKAAILSIIPGYMNLPFGKPLFIRNSIKALHKLSSELVMEYRNSRKSNNITNATTTDTKNLTSTTTTNNKGHIVINEKNTSEEDRKTLLKVLCDAYDANEGSLTDTEVVHNVFSFMAAGMSTTADSLSHMVLELARSKQIMQRLQKDVDEIVSKKKSIDNITWEDIDSCNYLTAVK